MTPTGEADPTLALYWETGVSSRDKIAICRVLLSKMKKFSNLPDDGNAAKCHEDGERNRSKSTDSKGNKKEALAVYYSALKSAQTLQETNSRTFGFGQKLRPTTQGEPVPIPVSKTPATGAKEKQQKRSFMWFLLVFEVFLFYFTVFYSREVHRPRSAVSCVRIDPYTSSRDIEAPVTRDFKGKSMLLRQKQTEESAAPLFFQQK